jgi:periplasmic protein TonB
MFDDFSTSAKDQQSRQRFRGSMAAAFVIYGSSSAAIVAATATVHQVVEEELTQVEFAAPPEPPPPPPPPVEVSHAPPSPRPKVKRPDLAPPDKISDEKIKESNKDLADSGETGPVGGFLDGAVGGTGTAPAKAPPPPPPAKAEPVIAALGLASNEKPKFPAKVKRQGIEGTVVVQFDVLENGTLTNIRIVSGPPELHETVLKTVATWRFQPARRGSKPIRMNNMKKSIVFRLEDA